MRFTVFLPAHAGRKTTLITFGPKKWGHVITYDANNWTDKGLENLRNMEEAFGVDHLIVAPPEELLKKMNLAGFLTLGDVSWHSSILVQITELNPGRFNSVCFLWRTRS